MILFNCSLRVIMMSRRTSIVLPFLVFVVFLAGVNWKVDPSLKGADNPAVNKQSAHLTKLGVDQWHAKGIYGQGVKVAILDSGFRGYRDHLGRALPKSVAVRTFRHDKNFEARDSQHGICCAEVIHSIAPGAELLFASWEPDDPKSFCDAVNWAREKGANVISCSVVMPSWSDGRGGGSAHDCLQRIVGTGERASDILGVASAGNLASRSWSGKFRPGKDGFHEWITKRLDNGIIPWEGGQLVSVELTWFGDCEYELIVWDMTTRQSVGSKLTFPVEGVRGSVVRFSPQPNHTYSAWVQLTKGKPDDIRLVVLGGGLEHATPANSIVFPADGASFLAVGAIDHDKRLMNYSSCGPNSPRLKPDLTAPVPFPSSCRENPFSGTSACAPQAAALAALLWSRTRNATPNEIRDSLKKHALDLGPIGHDSQFGAGMLRLIPLR
jgi:subtilisin family serine protease